VPSRTSERSLAGLGPTMGRAMTPPPTFPLAIRTLADKSTAIITQHHRIGQVGERRAPGPAGWTVGQLSGGSERLCGTHRACGAKLRRHGQEARVVA